MEIQTLLDTCMPHAHMPLHSLDMSVTAEKIYIQYARRASTPQEKKAEM